MKNYVCSEENFLKDVANHQMIVIRDDGVHRHVRFKRPESGIGWFDLITWPGTLCIDGDMGTYVFRRLEDMFEFFRTDGKYFLRDGIKLGINPGYWGEKVQAQSVFGGGIQEFSTDIFRQHVTEVFDSWAEENQPDGDADQEERDKFEHLKEELFGEITVEVLDSTDDGETRSYDAAMNFKSDAAPDFAFRDCWEWRCMTFTFHFIWCCYAIAWGVKTYDEAKAMQVAA